MAYKGCTGKINFSREKEDFIEGITEAGGSFPLKEAIEYLKNKHGGNLEVFTKRGIRLTSFIVHPKYVPGKNDWLDEYRKTLKIVL